MASSTIPLHHVTCAVCFEVYRDPHALQCLHVYCLSCVHKLQQHSTVECPECRTVSKMKHIRKDFRTQELVDAYNTAGGGGHIEDKMADLSFTHSPRMPSAPATDESLPPPPSYSEMTEHMFSSTEEMLRRQLSKAEHTNTQISEAIGAVEGVKNKQIEEVNRHIDELLRSVESHRRSVLQEIQDSHDRATTSLRTTIATFNDHISAIHSKMAALTKAKELAEGSGDSRELVDLVSVMKPEIQRMEAQIHTDSLQVNPLAAKTSPIKVIMGEKWKPQDSITTRRVSPGPGMPREPEVVVIIMNKVRGSLGVRVATATGPYEKEAGTYVKSVVPGGAASQDGRLQAGDQLIEVDGNSLIGLTHKKAAACITQTGDRLTLKVAKLAVLYHGLAQISDQDALTLKENFRRKMRRMAKDHFNTDDEEDYGTNDEDDDDDTDDDE